MAVAAPAPPKAATGTLYVILRLDESGGWHEFKASGPRTAANKEDAVKKAVGETEGVFKAVPERSWKGSVKLSVEKVTKVATESID